MSGFAFPTRFAMGLLAALASYTGIQLSTKARIKKPKPHFILFLIASFSSCFHLPNIGVYAQFQIMLKDADEE